MKPMNAAHREQARYLNAPVVPLEGVDLEAIGDVRREMVLEHGEEAVTKALPIYVFQRYQWVLGRAVGSSFLDVGYSHGVMLSAAAEEPRFGHVYGVEVKEGWLAPKDRRWESSITDGTVLPFDDDAFDTVSCQEVIEHLDDDALALMLAELRRVARRQLLITTPLCQQGRIPLAGHVQRFCYQRIATEFPRAKFTVLDKGNGRYPWLVIEEWRYPWE